MYQLVISTKAGYTVATFYAGTTMREANAVYYTFMQSGLYAGHCMNIRRKEI